MHSCDLSQVIALTAAICSFKLFFFFLFFALVSQNGLHIVFTSFCIAIYNKVKLKSSATMNFSRQHEWEEAR